MYRRVEAANPVRAAVAYGVDTTHPRYRPVDARNPRRRRYLDQPPAYSPRNTKAVPAVMRPMLRTLPACPMRLSVRVIPSTTKPARITMFMPNRSLVSIAPYRTKPEVGEFGALAIYGLPQPPIGPRQSEKE
jgi:hypothetical protein